MKILVLAPDVDLTKTKGDTIHLRNVLEAWIEDHEIHLVSATPSGALPIEPAGHSSVATGIGWGKAETILRLGTAVLTTTVRSLLQDFDLIYERHHLVGTGIPGAKLSGTSRAAEVNGYLPREHAIKGSLSPAAIRAIEPFERFVLSTAANVICVSPKLRSLLAEEQGLDPTKLHLVPNGVDTEAFRPIPNARERLGWDPSRQYVGFVGSLKPWHGVQQLLEGRAALSDSNVTLVIIGDGPAREQLERTATAEGIDEHVLFTGRIPYEEIPTYLSALDAGAILKHPEIPGSPLKLYEYLACGVPVVATNDIDFSMVEDRNVGVLVEYDDPQSIATGIERVLSWDSGELETRTRDVASERPWSTVAREAFDAATHER